MFFVSWHAVPYVDEYVALEPAGSEPELETADVLVTVYVAVSAKHFRERQAMTVAARRGRRFMGRRGLGKVKGKREGKRGV